MSDFQSLWIPIKQPHHLGRKTWNLMDWTNLHQCEKMTAVRYWNCSLGNSEQITIGKHVGKEPSLPACFSVFATHGVHYSRSPSINSRDAVNIASAKFINRYVQVTQWQVKPPGKGGWKEHTMFNSITLATAVLAASATIASAGGNYLSTFATSQERNTKVELGLVVAEANGTVEIRSYRNGQIGTLLGSEAVKAGGNPNVDVEITPSFGDAIAVLKVGDNTVDTEALNFSRN
jgi:hypothetical protein